MGCGASTVYEENGAIKAGKGKTDTEFADSIDVAFFWGDTSEQNVQCELRVFEPKPESLKAKFFPTQVVNVSVPLGVPFRIASKTTPGKSLDCEGGNGGDGTKVLQWDNHDGTNQQWKAHAAPGGFVYISPMHKQDSTLDTNNNDTDAPHLWSIGGTNPNQLWTFTVSDENQYFYLSAQSRGDKVLQVADGVLSFVAKDPKADNQKFSVTLFTGNDEPGLFFKTVSPGTIYQQRFNASHARVRYPGYPDAGIAPRIAAENTQDAKKFADPIKKLVEKQEGHPYNSPDGPAKLNHDLEDSAGFISVHQLHTDLNAFREQMILVEDNLPSTGLAPLAVCAPEVGFWDGDRVMNMIEDKLRMKDVKMNNPSIRRQMVEGQQKILRGILDGGLNGTCTAYKLKLEEFAPTFKPALDLSEGKRPLGVVRNPESIPKSEDETVEQMEATKEAREKMMWEDDKGKIAAWEAEDAKPVEERRKKLAEKLRGQYAAVTANTGNLIASVPDGVKTGCLARFQGKGNFLVPGYVENIHTADGTYNVTWPQTNVNDALTEWIQPKAKVSVRHNGVLADEEQPNIVSLPPPAAYDDLAFGTTVHVNTGDFAFVTGVVVERLPDQKVVVEDVFKNKYTAEAKDVWTALTVADVSGRAHVVPKNFFSVKFWWVAAEDDIPKQLNIWRTYGPESKKTITLEKVFGPMKPTKAEPNPGADKQVFLGWSGIAKVQPNRMYSYNYKVGDAILLDFGKEAAKNQDAHKRFTLQVSL